MKQITKCPLSKEKCSNKTNKVLSGCTLYSNVNECSKCTKYRKKISKHSKKQFNMYEIADIIRIYDN